VGAGASAVAGAEAGTVIRIYGSAEPKELFTVPKRCLFLNDSDIKEQLGSQDTILCWCRNLPKVF